MVITLLSLGVVALDVAIVAILGALCFSQTRSSIITIANRYGVLLLFLLALVSIAGTLYMQYAASLSPCVLCWWQRVCMYPIALISLIALVRGRPLKDIADYALALSVIGGAISLYQHLLQMLPAGTLIPCDATGECAVRSVFEFGFVTVPWMGFSVFVAIALVSISTFVRSSYSQNDPHQ